MYPVTIEQFQKFTNVEELVLQKMKEQGPKIYEMNYKHRHKHIKVIFKSFYDSKTRNKTLRMGLTMKPMPQSFKAKFLEFRTTNNITVETSSSSQNEVQKTVPSEPILLDAKYKDDKPSTSSAFVHKPRFGLKPESQQKLNVPSSKNINKIYPKISTQSTSKTRKRPEKNKGRKKLQTKLSDPEETKITNYFNSLELRKINPESKRPEQTIELRKRKSDPQKENTEQEPETKRRKVYLAKKKDTQNHEYHMKNTENQKKTQKTTQHKSKSRQKVNSDDFISDDSDAESNTDKENPTNQLNMAKSPFNPNNGGKKENLNKIQSLSKPRKRIIVEEISSSENSGDGEPNISWKQIVSLESPPRTSRNNLRAKIRPKSRRKENSVELMRNNCDINANIEIIDTSSQLSKREDGIEEKQNANKCSLQRKSTLPKRKRSEEHINISPIITKTPSRPTRLSKDYIEEWIERGQRALEANFDGYEPSRRSDSQTYKSAENIPVSCKLQTLKNHSENKKKFIKYWLKFEIQMRKGDNSVETVLSDSSMTKIASAFSKMTFDDFKNLTSAKKHTYTSNQVDKSDKSIAEDEENRKNQFETFIKKEKPWPGMHIELAKLQLFFHAQGIKGPIQLKDIPPRILSFTEVLEKTNIKQCISLNCKEPPESYEKLLSLCKKQYEICCTEGVWMEGLKLNDKNEENGSSQEMSVDLFTESMTMASPQLTPHNSENIQQDDNIKTEIDVVSKDLPIPPNLENASTSNRATKESLNKKDDKTQEQKELPDQPKISIKDATGPQQKALKSRPKSKRKKPLQSDDNLEIMMNEMFSNQDQYSPRSTIKPLIDNEELRKTLAKTQSQPSQFNSNEIPTCEDMNVADHADPTNVIKHSVEKVVDISASPTKKLEVLSKTNQVSLEPNPSSELSEAITSNTSLTNEGSNSKPSNFQNDAHNPTKACKDLESNEKPLQLSNEDTLFPTVCATRNNNPSKSQDNFNLIPPSPNIFASSGESDPKCTNSEAIEVQTQEYVYVPCEHTNNNFQTEQNNFSFLNISHENESLDPFGGITPNQGHTTVDELQGAAGKSKDSIICQESNTETRINRKIVLSEQNVSAGTNLDLQGVPETLEETATISVNKDVETLKSKESSLHPNTVPEDSVLNDVNLLTEPSTNSRNPIVASSETIKIQEQPKELTSRKSLNSKPIPKDISDSESHQLKKIVGCTDVPIEPTPQLTTVDVGSVETACNREETSMTSEQLAESVPDTNTAGVADNLVEPTLIAAIAEPTKDLNSVLENSAEKETTMEDMQSTETIPSQEKADVNVSETAENLTTINQTIDRNTTSAPPGKVVNRKDLNTSVSLGQTQNLQVVVKREIFTQGFSQYDDDVEIIEIPQSEPVVIEDEETAPELLRALLCRSPPAANRAPRTTAHVSYLTPSSSSLYNFPQAQRMPSSIELTQSQSTLNQPIHPENTESLCGLLSSTPTIARIRKSNRKCQGKEVIEKNSKPDEVAKRKKKTPALKQNLPPKSAFSSCKPMEQTQQSENTYISIAPQNIPSDIEFTQTGLNNSKSQEQGDCSMAIPSSEECEKSSTKNISGEAEQPGTSPKENNGLTHNAQECSVSIVVCLNEDCGKSNKESMDLGQSKNTKEVMKAKENIGSNKMLDPAPSRQCKEVKALELSNHESENDKDNVECQKNQEQSSSNLVEVSLDMSSDVEFLEESSENDSGVVEINKETTTTRAVASRNSQILEGNKEEEKEATKGHAFGFSTSKDVGKVTTLVTGDIDCLKVENKNHTKSNNNVGEVEVIADDDSDSVVELLQETVQNDTAAGGCEESYSESLRIIKVIHGNSNAQEATNCKLETKTEESELNAPEEDFSDVFSTSSVEVSLNVSSDVVFLEESTSNEPDVDEGDDSIGPSETSKALSAIVVGEIESKSEQDNEEVSQIIKSSGNRSRVPKNKDAIKSLNQGDACTCHCNDVSSDVDIMEESNVDDILEAFNDTDDVELLEDSESEEEVTDSEKLVSTPSSKSKDNIAPHTKRKEKHADISEDGRVILDGEDILKNQANIPKVLVVSQCDDIVLNTNAGVCEEAANQLEDINQEAFAEPNEATEISLQNLFLHVITPSNEEIEQIQDTSIGKYGTQAIEVFKVSELEDRAVHLVEDKMDDKNSRGHDQSLQLQLIKGNNQELVLLSKEISLEHVSNNAANMEIKTKEPKDHIPGEIFRKEKKGENVILPKDPKKNHYKEHGTTEAQTTIQSDIQSPTKMKTRDIGPIIDGPPSTYNALNETCSKAPDCVPIESCEEKEARQNNNNKHLLHKEHEGVLVSSKTSLNAEPCECLEDVKSQHAQEHEASKVLSTKIPNKVDSKDSPSAYTSKDKNETSESSLNGQIQETPLNESSSSMSKDVCDQLCSLSRRNSEDNSTTHSLSATKESSENDTQEYNLRVSSESQTDLSEGKVTQKNATESETYSQAFEKLAETSRKDIVTSTQLEIVAPVENHDESLQAFESSHDSSVEFIDLTFGFSDNEDEEKFSKTAIFEPIKTSRNHSSSGELSANSKDGSELIVPDDIVLNEHFKPPSPCVAEELSATDIDAAKEQNHKSLESLTRIQSSSEAVAKNLEASTTACKETLYVKKNLNSDPCCSAFSGSTEDIINLKQNSNHKQIANYSKNIDIEENLQSSDLENQSQNIAPSNNSSVADLIENEDEEHRSFNLENKGNEIINNKDNRIASDGIRAEASKSPNFSPENLQKSAFVEETTIGLNPCIFLNENENYTGTDPLVIDQRRNEEEAAEESQVDTSIMHNLKNPFDTNTKHLYRGNKNIRRRRTISETHTTPMLFGLNQPSVENALPKNKAQTLVLPAFLPISAFQANQQQTDCYTDSGKQNENDFVEVPFMIDRNLLKSLPFTVVPLEQHSKENCPTYAIRVNLELKLKEQHKASIKNPSTISQDAQMSPTIPRIQYDEKSIEKSLGTLFLKNIRETEEDPIICRHSPSPPHKRPKIQVENNIKRKLPQACKKKTTPKKSSKLPDFVPQKTHAFPSLPLAAGKKQPQNKPSTTKQPSLLTIEECDYIIEDASLPVPTTTASQILGTDCTYFENSELLRNLDNIGIPHPPDVPALQIEQRPSQPTSTSSKVINLIPKIMSEGVTARKVWQVNLQWKSRRAMSIEVRFSFNKHSMTVCDESAKLLFNFTPAIWSDVHRILKEIDHFEYKRFASKNLCKTTPLHKVLRHLFHSSTGVVDVKLVSDTYSPYTICEKTIPRYRKPLQCLTKGIDADILNRMRLLKESLQNNNSTVK